MTPRRLRPAAALAATGALLLAGCLADAPQPSISPTATPEPAPTATVTTYPIQETVWYGGLVLTFGTATATLDVKGGPVSIELQIENPGADDATLDAPVLLTAGGVEVPPSRETVFPTVAAGGSSALVVTFVVDATFDVPSAAIRVGRPPEHRAVVPLLPGRGEAVTLEPVITELSGGAQAGSLLVELRGLELRADLPDWHQELPLGVLALTLTYDATFRSDFSGGFPFTADNVGLLLPDGTTVAPRRDGHSQSVLVIGPRVREAGLRSRFEVPATAGGAYALIVRDGKPKEVPFTIELP